MFVTISRTNSEFCPLSSMIRYLNLPSHSHFNEPLFATDNGNIMTRCWFTHHLRLLCQHCGLAPQPLHSSFLPHRSSHNRSFYSPCPYAQKNGTMDIICFPTLHSPRNRRRIASTENHEPPHSIDQPLLAYYLIFMHLVLVLGVC